MQIQPKLLLIEDDRSIAGAVSCALKCSYDVDIAMSGRVAIYKADTEHYDLIVLDLNLPDMSGIEICQLLRERGVHIPILVLTADHRVLTKIKSLDAGANDYLTKSFSLGEFKARLRVLLRKGQMVLPTRRELSVGGLVLDRQTYSVSREGVRINLRRKEFALLECLMEHSGSVVTRQTLTRYAWPGTNDLWTNTVDVHIKYLRDKVDRPFEKPLIKTIHGLGYKLEPVVVCKKIHSPAKY